MELVKIKGVGEKKRQLLNKLNIFNSIDLINHFPRNYIDFSNFFELNSGTSDGQYLVKAHLIREAETLYSSSHTKYLKAEMVSNGYTFSCIWFNNPYVKNKLKLGVEYAFYGRVQNKYGKLTMFNPVFEETSSLNILKGFMPNYMLTEGLTNKELISFILNALQQEDFSSVIPRAIEEKYGLISLKDAYFLIHNPRNYIDINIANTRIAIEEILNLSISFYILKNKNQVSRTNFYTDKNIEKLTDFIKNLPFELTISQKNAVDTLLKRLKSNTSINVLLNGDVGSGKTIVVFILMYYAFLNGYQTTIMAPTEVLAKQHFENAKKLFEQLNVDVEFLSGSVTQKNKEIIKEKIKNGTANMVIGTHALIEDNVCFKNLSLVVTDEQHRFGVNMRDSLNKKGDGTDVIVMSATPIPRTLSLVVFGDMDAIYLTDKPKDRKKVDTFIIPNRKIEDMYGFIKKELDKGNKAYMVCSKIGEDETEEDKLKSVKNLFNELKNKFKGYNVAFLHGKMKKDEKQSVMSDFSSGKTNLLVSTTVVEVGVDVKEATVIVIYNADRFGLTSLHQLRGRVGRNDKDSYCFLLTDSKNEKSIERLKILTKTYDGEKIAEEDFKLRGGGEFLGTRQSGFINSVFKKLKIDGVVLKKSKAIKEEIISNTEYLNHFLSKRKDKFEKVEDIVL